MAKTEMTVLGTPIRVMKRDGEDFVCLTDIARQASDDPSAVIANWMRNRMTIEYLGLWERLNNPVFNSLEFEGIKNKAGLNAFTMSPKKWVGSVNAIGIITQGGRYNSGTYARTDIAFKFASWVSVEFELYLIREFQRLKQEEQKQLGWSVKRELAKINYHVHTDAVKEHLVPAKVTPQQASFVYASEADVLNVALFGMTAKEWRVAHPDLKGNMRDYASINQLICLSNMENLNAVFIHEGLSQYDRLLKLNAIAIQQMKVLCAVRDNRLITGRTTK